MGFEVKEYRSTVDIRINIRNISYVLNRYMRNNSDMNELSASKRKIDTKKIWNH